MARRFAEAEVVEVWDRWQAGEANRLIGRDRGRSAASIRAFVESWGGVRPRVRRRSPRHLSLIEREEISRGVAAGDSVRSIGVRSGRAPSTISRELAGNDGRGGYRAHRADRAALGRARRPKPSKLAENPQLRAVVEDKLAEWWSPEQVARCSAVFGPRPSPNHHQTTSRFPGVETVHKPVHESAGNPIAPRENPAHKPVHKPDAFRGGIKPKPHQTTKPSPSVLWLRALLSPWGVGCGVESPGSNTPGPIIPTAPHSVRLVVVECRCGRPRERILPVISRC